MTSKKQNNRLPTSTVAIVVIVCIALVGIIASCIITISKGNVVPVDGSYITTVPEETEPPVPVKENTVTIGSTGDVLIHKPVYQAAYLASTGEYDFNNIFTYCSSEIQSCDYFVANLETTLAGTENGRTYTSYPLFNSPDSIADALKNSGVDCLLTANNHSYDTSSFGLNRTQQVVKEKGLDYVGTRTSEDEDKYFVKDIGGINFGFTCYTYETDPPQAGRKALNGIVMDTETAPLINSFDYNNLDAFYDDIGSQLSAMKKKGADILVVYIHWGTEYSITPSSYQTAIAQKLCDMGVDVIIGGHPHVVQPVELITSQDSSHKTVCVYSMGNMVSNQRRQYMGLKTGHTEDGMFFEMSFSKYSDGSVVFENIEVIPTWVHLYSEGGKNVYNVVPLSSDLDSDKTTLGLDKSSSGLSLAKESYERTMKLVSDGVNECNDYLSSLPRPDEEPTTPTVTESTTEATTEYIG
ncbi:MAG: CapA family protein [Acutalibacteraceae bacterium]